jgi:hypothetical protein
MARARAREEAAWLAVYATECYITSRSYIACVLVAMGRSAYEAAGPEVSQLDQWLGSCGRGLGSPRLTTYIRRQEFSSSRAYEQWPGIM